MAKELTDQEFQNLLTTSDKPVLVDFWAPWCGPCKQLGPILSEVSDEMKDKVTIVKINVDDHPDAAARYHVRGIPTMVILKNGQAADSKVGALSKTALTDWINSVI